ncbi:hypothetical protein HYX10_02080 [Candidatus Woesearchaeota archaeon]|nr:hypothetical protein [Candidatus Woesearchaeota archaeon]
MDYARIQYAPIRRAFNRDFAFGLVRQVADGCKSVNKSAEKEMLLRDVSDAELGEILYNNGEGESLFFQVNDLYNFAIHAGPKKSNVHIVISVPLPFLRKANSKRVIEDIISRSKAVYDYLRPEYAIGDEEGLFIDKKVEYKDGVFWLNFYSPQVVERIGIEKLKSVPYGTIDELADGGVLLIRGRTPDENSEHRTEIKRYLFGRGFVNKLFGR